MTVQEFRDRQADLSCKFCDKVGALTEVTKGAHIGVRCDACGRDHALAECQWLAQNAPKRPKSKAGDTDLVWAENGNRCSFCGKSRDLCKRLGILLTVQHVNPVMFGGSDDPVIPYCSRCQQASVAALAETARFESYAADVQAIITRMEDKFPELRQGTRWETKP